jgi:hypothetical protein
MNNLSENIVTDLKKYIILTEKINELNSQVNKLKIERDLVESKLIPEMLKNNLDKKKIQYNNKKISIRNEKTYTNLSFKYLNEKLNNYLKNEKLVKEIIQYLKNERDVKINKAINF